MSNLIYFDEITDTDLRRALLFYLVGISIYLLSLYLWIVDFAAGLAADPGTVDPEFTPQWIKAGLLVVSASVVVPSQLYYLRTKHVRRERGSLRGLLRACVIELTVVLWILFLWAVFGIIYTESSDALGFRIIGTFVGFLTTFSAWVLLIGTPAYFPVILYWVIKRSVDRSYPDVSRYARIGVSFALGLVSAVVAVFLLTFTVLSLLNSVGAI